jgi:hypothetical protein
MDRCGPSSDHQHANDPPTIAARTNSSQVCFTLRRAAQYFLIRRLTVFRAAGDIRRRFRRGRSIVAAGSEDMSICGRLRRDPSTELGKVLSKCRDLGLQLLIPMFCGVSRQFENLRSASRHSASDKTLSY